MPPPFVPQRIVEALAYELSKDVGLDEAPVQLYAIGALGAISGAPAQGFRILSPGTEGAGLMWGVDSGWSRGKGSGLG